MVVTPQECPEHSPIIDTMVTTLCEIIDEYLLLGIRSIHMQGLVHGDRMCVYKAHRITMDKYRDAGWKVTEFSGDQREPTPLTWIFYSK